jgi:hypothetical protein
MGRSDRDSLATPPHRLRLTPSPPDPSTTKDPLALGKPAPPRDKGRLNHALNWKKRSTDSNLQPSPINTQPDEKSRLGSDDAAIASDVPQALGGGEDTAVEVESSTAAAGVGGHP